MSFVSFVLSFAPALAARFMPRQENEQREEPERSSIEVRSWQSELEAAEDRNEFLSGLLCAMERELRETQRERDMWREAATRPLVQWQATQAQQTNAAALQQMVAQQAQNAQQVYRGVGPLGVQAYPDGWASCTPSRSRALTGLDRLL